MIFLKRFVHVADFLFLVLKYSSVKAIIVCEISIAAANPSSPIIDGSVSISMISVIILVMLAIRGCKGFSSLNTLAFLMLTQVEGIIAKLII